MSALDWPVDADGYPHREAARVLLFDGEGRVLLAKGHDEDQPERSWWFTIGGGIEAGEEPREAAVREVYEETGLRLDVDDLLGPVLYRRAQFDFLAVTARQDEWFFIARAPSTTLNANGWTDLERSVIDAQNGGTLTRRQPALTARSTLRASSTAPGNGSADGTANSSS